MPSKLLRNGTVLAWNETTQKVDILQRASILITDDRIAAITENQQQLKVPSDTEEIDVDGKIITPGFVNTHVHMWQTAYRTIGPDIFVVQYFLWLSQMSPATKAFTPEDLYISCMQGYLDGINGGTTSFVDHAHNNWGAQIMKAGYEAAVDAGARVWWCYDVNQRDNFSMDEQWKLYDEIAAEGRGQGNTVSLGLSYDGLAHSSDEEFSRGIEAAKRLGIEAITTHHIGGPWPVGDNGPNFMIERGLHNSELPIIFSHAGYLTDDEMKTLRDKDLYISITPESEFHHGHGQTTGARISDHASIGCDGNWTYSGDILGQTRLWLQTARHHSYLEALKRDELPNSNPMTVEQAFLLATRQGGRALRRDDIGVLKVGAKADIVVWNSDSPNMVGWTNPIAAVMLHANVGDVEHVIVNGLWKKRDFRLLNSDKWKVEGIKAKFRDAARRIQEQVGGPPEVPGNWFGKDLGDVAKSTTIVST